MRKAALTFAPGLLVLLHAATGAAADCAATRLVVPDEIPPAWHDAVRTLRGEVAHLAAEDCQEMTLSLGFDPGDARARLDARTPDGRRAMREIPRPAALVPTVLAVVIGLPPDRRDAEPPAPAAGAPRVPTGWGPDPLPPPDEPTPAAAPPARKATWALGGGIAFRSGMPTGLVAPDLSLRADLRWPAWFVYVGGRYVPVGGHLGMPIQSYTYQEIAFGAGGGRRFTGGAGVLEIALGAEAVVATEEGNAPSDGGGTAMDLRAVASGRWLFGHGRWQPYVVADAQVTPLAFPYGTVVDPTLPALPTWTLGLGAGLSLGL